MGEGLPYEQGGLRGIAPPEAALWQIFGNSRVMSYRMDFYATVPHHEIVERRQA
jgi:hypothetical protein